MSKRNKLLAALMALTMCLSFTFNANVVKASDAYTEQTAIVHVYSEDNIQPLQIRFYKGLSAPYIKLTDYYRYLTGKEMSVQKNSDGDYTFKSAMGATAVIDTDENTLYSSDFDNFINTTITKQDNVPNVYYDGYPFVEIYGATPDKAPEPKTIDFDNYSIDLIEDESQGDIWIPYLTASDMFSGVVMYRMLYDSKEFYILDENSDYTYMDVVPSDKYQGNVKNYLKEGKRDKSLAEYSYNEMCFVYDNYFGYPEQMGLGAEIKEKGLDETLKQHDIFTAQAREWFLSDDPAEYVAATVILDDYLSDGGHTYLGDMGATYFSEDTIDDAKQLLYSMDFGFSNTVALGTKFEKMQYLQQMKQDKWGDEYFHIEGDTALFSFDSFVADEQAWRDYYENGGELPDDTVGDFKRALDAAADANVKNFVIDLSSNGGGSADVVFLMACAMTGNAKMSYQNAIGGQFTTVQYLADINFDKVFDYKDFEPYDFNFGVLTSDYSFSCANFLPAICKSEGIAILGEQSGGGACAVIPLGTAEGGVYQISSAMRLSYPDGTSVDGGVPVDVNLVSVNADGTNDYSAFYDLQALSSAMNEFYANK